MAVLILTPVRMTEDLVTVLVATLSCEDVDSRTQDRFREGFH